MPKYFFETHRENCFARPRIISKNERLPRKGTAGWQRYFEERERFCRVLERRAKWRVRPYAPGDETNILALCQKNFGSVASLQEWRWRTFENPVGPALIFVAEEKETGRIVGHLAAISTDLKVGSFTRKGFFLIDSVVDPSHRGRGIHAVLTFAISKASCERDGGFGFGLPNDQAYLPTLKIGAVDLFTMSLLVKVLDWHKLLRARVRPAFLADGVGGLIQLFRRRGKSSNCADLIIEEVTRFSVQADDLWGRISYRFPILASRRAVTLNWRYFERPDSPYSVFSISRTGQWQGYVVLRVVEKWGLRVGVLVDLFFDPECVMAGALLLHHAEQYLRSNGAEVLWGLFAMPEIYQKVFRKAGFLTAPRLRWLRQFRFIADFVTIEYLRPDLEERDGALLKKGDNWFFTLGDTDLA
jgi:GNAT superfamily N-acetyltransferase